MFVELTQDEIDKIHAKADILKASDSLSDKICALLIDTRIGNMGLHDQNARQKADAIWEMLVEWAASAQLSEKLKSGLENVLKTHYNR